MLFIVAGANEIEDDGRDATALTCRVVCGCSEAGVANDDDNDEDNDENNHNDDERPLGAKVISTRSAGKQT